MGKARLCSTCRKASGPPRRFDALARQAGRLAIAIVGDLGMIDDGKTGTKTDLRHHGALGQDRRHGSHFDGVLGSSDLFRRCVERLDC